MQTKKINSILIAFVLGLGLSACSTHSNPLKSGDPDNAAKFLVSASQYAEKQLNVFQAPGGEYYGICMENKTATVNMQPQDCQKLYKQMVEYAKSQADYKHLTVADLQDQKVYKILRDYYQKERFDTI